MEININLDGVLLVANNLSDVANAAYARLNIGAEPIITAGVNTQYWRGDKTWQTLNTTAVSEGINLYYTQARFDTAFAAKTTTNLNEGINLYFTEDKVRDTDLAGLSITGGSIGATDTVLEAFGKLQNQIAGLLGGAIVQGVWNATTNTPALASGVGTTGYYYVVNVAGSTNLDGITDWKVGDWAIFINGAWNKVDNTDAVSSVNGYVGAVSLVKSDIGLGNVENTALSTWGGTSNITTVGTIGTGTWQGTTIGKQYGGTGVDISTTALTLGTASANNGSIVFHNSSNANTITIVSGITSASYSLTLPTGQGGANTFLKNDGSGVLSWASAVGVAGADTEVQFNDGGSQAGDADFTWNKTTNVLNVTGGYNIGTVKFANQYATGLQLAIGYLSGQGVTMTSNSFNANYAYNTLVGIGAGNAISGSYAGQNTAFGYEALKATGGGGNAEVYHNTAVGFRALGTWAGGTGYNVAVGYMAGYGTGSALRNSTFIGWNAGNGSTASNSMALGYNATTTAANQCVIGAAAAASGAGVYNDIYFNGVTFTDPAIITLRNCGESGSNQTSSAYFRIIPSLGTGTGVGSYFTIWTGDAGSTGSTLNTPTEKMRLAQGGDLVLGITSDTKGLVLKSPDGHYWRITVDNAGVLSTADLGTSIPT